MSRARARARARAPGREPRAAPRATTTRTQTIPVRPATAGLCEFYSAHSART
jgi:hypothetical protein